MMRRSVCLLALTSCNFVDRLDNVPTDALPKLVLGCLVLGLLLGIALYEWVKQKRRAAMRKKMRGFY